MGTIIGSMLAIAFLYALGWSANQYVKNRYGVPRPRLVAGIMLVGLLVVPVLFFAIGMIFEGVWRSF